MLKRWLEKLLSQGRRDIPADPEGPLPNPRLSQMVTFGAHMYRSKGEVAEVIFMDDLRNIRKTIVDDSGKICDFPGILQEDRWTGALTSQVYLQPQIRFRTSFTREADGRFRMVWEIQPDGRYWADDDGFGMENDEEIRLYTHLDRNGSFTGPFRIYSVGKTCFYQDTTPQ